MINVLKNFSEKFYFVQAEEDTAAIFFVQPYQPFKSFPKDKLSVDAYYLCSNKVYFRLKEIAIALTAQSFEAKANPDFNFKKLLLKTGEFIEGKNTLLYYKEYGSRFAIGCVSVKAKIDGEEKPPLSCLNCGKCVSACPTGAITKEGFLRNRCIRELMNHEEISAEIAKKIGNRIYGCDTCQRVCPLNKQEEVLPPQELLDFLDIDNMIESAKSGKKALKTLSNYIGENYNRPQRILRLAEIAKANRDGEKE